MDKPDIALKLNQDYYLEPEKMKDINNILAIANARQLTAQKLPELAAAVGQRIGEVKITQIGASDKNPYASLLEAVHGVADLVLAD